MLFTVGPPLQNLAAIPRSPTPASMVAILLHKGGERDNMTCTVVDRWHDIVDKLVVGSG